MDSEVKRVEPLFFLSNEVEQEQVWLNTLEVCLAICSVVTDETHVEGAHKFTLQIMKTEQNYSAQVSI